MHLIDTNIIIWILRGEKTYLELKRSLKKESILYISTITVAEVYKNVYPAEMVKTDEILNEFELINVTDTIAKLAGLYWQQFIKKFKNLNILDCIIAATAREYDLTLVTLNSRHFPMNDISILDPVRKMRQKSS